MTEYEEALELKTEAASLRYAADQMDGEANEILQKYGVLIRSEVSADQDNGLSVVLYEVDCETVVMN